MSFGAAGASAAIVAAKSGSKVTLFEVDSGGFAALSGGEIYSGGGGGTPRLMKTLIEIQLKNRDPSQNRKCGHAIALIGDFQRAF